jgi:hypothetical protein
MIHLVKLEIVEIVLIDPRIVFHGAGEFQFRTNPLYRKNYPVAGSERIAVEGPFPSLERIHGIAEQSPEPIGIDTVVLTDIIEQEIIPGDREIADIGAGKPENSVAREEISVQIPLPWLGMEQGKPIDNQ